MRRGRNRSLRELASRPFGCRLGRLPANARVVIGHGFLLFWETSRGDSATEDRTLFRRGETVRLIL